MDATEARSRVLASPSNEATMAPVRGVDFSRDVHCLLGLPFDAVDMTTTVSTVRHAAHSRCRCFISTPNLNFVVNAQADASFRESVLRSDLVLADGMPLVWIARVLKLPLRERVSGAGLFERLLDEAGSPLSVFFFGGPPDAARRACERVNREGRGLRCVGFEEPGYVGVEEMSSDEHIAWINRSEAQFVIASLGAKKGQAWLLRNAARLTAPLLCHLGAVVNFAAGTLRRAPRWMQAAGLEWLWRIKEEPALWRRYAGDGLALLRMLLTRVLPCAVTVRRRIVGAFEPASIRTQRQGLQIRIVLSGAWTRDSLAPLRAELDEAARGGNSVTLDLAGVSYGDSAFLGLLLIARGAFANGLTLLHADARLARLFRWHGAEFLLSAGTAHG